MQCNGVKRARASVTLPAVAWSVWDASREACVKKVAIGCLVVLVVLGVAGGIGSYFVYRTIKATFGDTLTQLAALSKTPEIERQVRNTTGYAPPADGVLSPAQVERFVAVQAAVRTQMGARFAELEKRYKTLIDKKEATALDLPELLSAYKDLAGVWLAGKQAQVDALNAQRFSLEEYRSVRDRTYRALGIPLMSVDISQIIDKAMRGESVEQPPTHFEGSVGPTGPDANQKLIEQHKKALEDNAALAIFGL